MKRVLKAIVFLIACPSAAFAGWCIGGLTLGNALNIVVRYAQERGSISNETAGVCVPFILAIGTLCAGFSFVWAGRKTLPTSNMWFLVAYVLSFSILIFVPSGQNESLGCLGVVWLGFIAGSCIGGLKKTRTTLNKILEDTVASAPDLQD